MKWVWFVVIQLISLVFLLIGLLVLIPFCLAQRWHMEGHSIKDGRPIDRWNSELLNFIYGNPEDGVSGQQALIWEGDELVHYLPDAGPSWRAYKWSALRNSCGGLKYVFGRLGCVGPYIEGTFTLRGHPYSYSMGWKVLNTHWNVPVISANRMDD